MLGNRKGAAWKSIVMLLVVAGLGIYLYQGFSEPDETGKMQATPEGAMQAYLTAAWGHLTSDNNSYIIEIKRAVTEDDWNWFNSNYHNLFADSFNFGGAVDPNEAEARAKFMAMEGLLRLAPHRTDADIGTAQINGDIATLPVEKMIQPGQSVTVNVQLVKEGRTWKVKDFAGARSAVTMGSTVAPVAGI